MRVDAALEQVSPSPGVLKLRPLKRQIAEIRAIGAEPLVILSYTPRWLGAPHAAGRDPTLVAPVDLDAWERLVYDVVEALATARAPARRFEAWNEPDLPLFWQDTPLAWLETVTRSARALANVERDTGLNLAFGGPATALPDPLWLLPFLAVFRDQALPLDFVSWHYYGNYPLLGPDGAEFAGTELLLALLGASNPLTTPAIYRAQIELMRSLVDAGLGGWGRPPPKLVLSEWNLSAGGLDRRHDSHVGAAFTAASMIEMQSAGLGASAYFRADDARPPGSGDHGVVFADGRRKPVWWAFELWRRLHARRVAVAGADRLGGLFATASRSLRAPRVSVLVSSFSALAPSERGLTIDVDGRRVLHARVTRIDAEHSAARRSRPVRIVDGSATVGLPAQAVALVELRLAQPAVSASRAGSPANR